MTAEILVSEKVDSTPELLAVKITRLLPHIVRVREHGRLSSHRLLDGAYSGCLVVLTWARLAVALTRGRPSALQVDARFACAEIVDELELAGCEGTGILGGDVGVEEGVDVGTGDVDDGAENVGDAGFLPDVKGLGGCALAAVSCAAELGLGGRDEVREFLSRAVFVEDSLVSDDDELNKVPLGPRHDFVDLLLGI